MISSEGISVIFSCSTESLRLTMVTDEYVEGVDKLTGCHHNLGLGVVVVALNGIYRYELLDPGTNWVW